MSNESVTFKNATHQYLSNKGELISVSKFVELFEEHIDWNEKAKSASKNLKKYKNIIKSPKQLLAEWAEKRIKGSNAGTIVHEIKEMERLNSHGYVKYAGHKGEGKESIPLQNLENGWIYPELMIYDFEYMICGQSDEIEIVDNTINVIDYKTDKEISFKAFSSKWTAPEKFLPPINHLEKCSGNIYSLKMSLYMYMLWKANKGKLKPGKIILKWCPIERDGDGIPVLYDGIPKILKDQEQDIEIPYRKKEVMAMLEHYKTNKK